MILTVVYAVALFPIFHPFILQRRLGVYYILGFTPEVLRSLYKIIEEQSYTISDLRKDKIELRLEKNEWKTKYEVKDNSLQKMIEELTVEKAKVSELTQKIGVHNHDGSSSWIKLEQEEIFNAGEGGLENESFD